MYSYRCFMQYLSKPVPTSVHSTYSGCMSHAYASKNHRWELCLRRFAPLMMSVKYWPSRGPCGTGVNSPSLPASCAIALESFS